MKEKGGNDVYKIFIVKVLSMHLSATWQFCPFQRPWTGGLMDRAIAGGGGGVGVTQVGEKAQRKGEFKSTRTP